MVLDSADKAQGALQRAVSGDARALAGIAQVAHESLRQAANSLPVPLMVSRSSVIAVLKALHEGSISAEDAQLWASFVRRGYIPGGDTTPILPIDIAFENEFEELIVTAVARLDELGDVVDGDLESSELAALLAGLGHPDSVPPSDIHEVDDVKELADRDDA